VRLVSSLPESDKEAEGDYLVILRNWYPGGIYSPTIGGRAGG